MVTFGVTIAFLVIAIQIAMIVAILNAYGYSGADKLIAILLFCIPQLILGVVTVLEWQN